MLNSLHGSALRYFLAVARAGSLTAASETLHIAISAISRQITKLEMELGLPLFERQARGMIVTEAGRKLLVYATRSLLEADQVTRDIQELDDLKTGTIRLATAQGFSDGLVPATIANFSNEYPGLRFELFVGSPLMVSQSVRDGEADIGLTYSITATPGVKAAHAELASIYVLMNKNDPLASNKSISVIDVIGRKMVLPASGTTLRDLLETRVAASGSAFRHVILESNNLSVIYRVAQRTGALMFTAMVSVNDQYKDEGMVAVALSDKEFTQRSIQIQTMAGRVLPTAVSRFRDYLTAALRDAVKP